MSSTSSMLFRGSSSPTSSASSSSSSYVNKDRGLDPDNWDSGLGIKSSTIKAKLPIIQNTRLVPVVVLNHSGIVAQFILNL